MENFDINCFFKGLSELVSVSAVNNTQVFKISVINENNILAADITNELLDVFSREIQVLYNMNNVYTMDKAEVSNLPYNINHVKDIVIFGVIGFVVAFCLVIVIYLLDTTIKSECDVENYAGLCGLSNCLSDIGSNGSSVNINKYIHKTNINNLHVMTSGVVPPNPSELLSSPNMKKFLEALNSQYDVVINKMTLNAKSYKNGYYYGNNDELNNSVDFSVNTNDSILDNKLYINDISTDVLIDNSNVAVIDNNKENYDFSELSNIMNQNLKEVCELKNLYKNVMQATLNTLSKDDSSAEIMNELSSMKSLYENSVSLQKEQIADLNNKIANFKVPAKENSFAVDYEHVNKKSNKGFSIFKSKAKEPIYEAPIQIVSQILCGNNVIENVR